MGEIKSTLDLVMEKTKHLTLSDEEKVMLRRAEVDKKIYGIVRKYQDNLIAKTFLEKEMDVIRKTYGVHADQILRQTLLGSLELGGRNEPALELLRDICGVDISGFERLFQDFLDQVGSAAKDRGNAIKKDLAKTQSISGTAVIPNLEADHEWLSVLGETKVKFDKILNQEKRKRDLSKPKMF
jgi:hypothetical protein